MMPLAAFALAGCLSVGAVSDQVLLGDLASAFPNLSDVAEDTPVALAPAPAVQRRFDLVELHRLAVRLHLPEPVREVCIERRVAPLDPSRLLAAMHAQLPAAEIELQDYLRRPVPDGELEFSRNGLHAGAAVSYWSGAIRYAGNRRFPVWAKVKVAPDVTRGQTVRVEVHSGGATLAFDAEAQMSGAAGQTIVLLNPLSKRRFSGQVDGKGKVSVIEPGNGRMEPRGTR